MASKLSREEIAAITGRKLAEKHDFYVFATHGVIEGKLHVLIQNLRGGGTSVSPRAGVHGVYEVSSEGDIIGSTVRVVGTQIWARELTHTIEHILQQSKIAYERGSIISTGNYVGHKELVSPADIEGTIDVRYIPNDYTKRRIVS